MPVLRQQSGSDGSVGRHPFAVGEGDHPILGALPHGGRNGQRAQAEAPIPYEREVVVEPAPDPVPEALTDVPGQERAQPASQRGFVDFAHEVTEGCNDLLAGDRPEVRRSPGTTGALPGRPSPPRTPRRSPPPCRPASRGPRRPRARAPRSRRRRGRDPASAPRTRARAGRRPTSPRCRSARAPTARPRSTCPPRNRPPSARTNGWSPHNRDAKTPRNEVPAPAPPG